MITELKRHALLGFLLIACIVFFQACGKYTPRAFNTLSRSSNKKTLNVVAHQLTSSESKDYFNIDVTKPSGMYFSSWPGYQAIHISIENNTKDPYVFRADRINGPLAYWYEVWEKIQEPFENAFNNLDDRYATIKTIEKDIKTKTFNSDDTQVILNGRTFNTFLFIPKTAECFYLSLVLINERTGEEKVFEFDL